LLITKHEHQLLCILRTRSIQTVVATLPSALDERLLRLRILQQILLHVTTHLLIVRLMEKGTVQVINVSTDILHAYSSLTSLSEYLQYLLVVTQSLMFNVSERSEFIQSPSHVKKGRYAV
jgi:hypothetical protein